MLVRPCLTHWREEEEHRRNPSRHPELNVALQEYEDAGGIHGMDLYQWDVSDYYSPGGGHRWAFRDVDGNTVIRRSLEDAIAYVRSMTPPRVSAVEGRVESVLLSECSLWELTLMAPGSPPGQDAGDLTVAAYQELTARREAGRRFAEELRAAARRAHEKAREEAARIRTARAGEDIQMSADALRVLLTDPEAFGVTAVDEYTTDFAVDRTHVMRRRTDGALWKVGARKEHPYDHSWQYEQVLVPAPEWPAWRVTKVHSDHSTLAAWAAAARRAGLILEEVSERTPEDRPHILGTVKVAGAGRYEIWKGWPTPTAQALD